MTAPYSDPVSPYPGWIRQIYRLSRPITREDVDAFAGGQEIYVRETPSGQEHIIHKYGLMEIHCLIGEREIEIWFSPEKSASVSDYLDALLATRF